MTDSQMLGSQLLRKRLLKDCQNPLKIWLCLILAGVGTTGQSNAGEMQPRLDALQGSCRHLPLKDGKFVIKDEHRG